MVPVDRYWSHTENGKSIKYDTDILLIPGPEGKKEKTEYGTALKLPLYSRIKTCILLILILLLLRKTAKLERQQLTLNS